jgi:hypothetical protein
MANKYAFEFSVKQAEVGDGCEPAPGKYEARTPYRDVVWFGDTEQEAIGCMLRGLCELGRSGALNPDDPHAPGKAAATP